jgi:diguanylate cyclase (GGDEF)-like protein/PAS domain S-box-containing protein
MVLLMSPMYSKYLIQVVMLTFAYVLAAKIGLMLAFEQENISPVWPPTGIAIAALLCCGLRLWPGILLGAFITNFDVSATPSTSLYMAIGNTLEALVASIIVKRFASDRPFMKTHDTVIFLAALFVATMLGASVGVASLLSADVISSKDVLLSWQTWWIGDFVGGMVLTPFILTWTERPAIRMRGREIAEACLLVILTVLVMVVVFGSKDILILSDKLLAFMLLPILAWSALRFYHHGATLIVMVISAGAITGTVSGFGPFVLSSENDSLMALQACIGAAMFTALLLMASQGERQLVLDILHENEQKLEIAVSNKTQQLEQTNALLETEMQQQTLISQSMTKLLDTIDVPSRDDFFMRCTQALCSIYQSNFAFIGVFADVEQSLIKTLAVFSKGEIEPNFIYPLKGTPCEDVLNLSQELVAENVACLYPEDDLLHSMGIQSYFGAPLKSASGKTLGVIAVMDDRPMSINISLRSVLELFASKVANEIERRKALEELELAASVFRESMEGVIICDVDAKIIRVNPEFCKITGYSEAEVLGHSPKLLKSGQHTVTFYDSLWSNLQKQGFWKGEIINKRKNGETFISWQLIKSVKDQNGEVQRYISIIHDISEKKRTDERIFKLAQQDLITQLPNRTAFHSLLKNAINVAMHSTNRLAVMFIDLDHFKLINDTSGHPVGDELLQQVAIRLKNIIGARNVISRFGGDEFTVLLHAIESTQEVISVATDISAALLKPFKLSSCDVTISASIGIALYPDNAQNASTLLSCADNAMYRAKESGRGSYEFYTDQMQLDAHERVILERDLRSALANREMYLHYQPQISIEHHTIIGVEALLRWRHPQKGLIPPDKFIPVAESTGLIVPIGEWVISEACRQLSLWRAQGNDTLVMSINLSARQFFQKTLLESIKKVLTDTAVPPEKIEFEITESMMMNNIEETILTLNQLKALGVQLSVDDFGTGYSSLSYLKKFPINKLKIDKSFVDGLPDDKDDLAIVQAIIGISHALELKVIAEGVETAEQLAVLSEMQCNEIQGYYFSKPLPAEQIVFPENGCSQSSLKSSLG